MKAHCEFRVVDGLYTKVRRQMREAYLGRGLRMARMYIKTA